MAPCLNDNASFASMNRRRPRLQEVAFAADWPDNPALSNPLEDGYMMKRAAPVVLPSLIGLLVSVMSGSVQAQGLVVPKKEKAGEEAAVTAPLEVNWLDYGARPLTLTQGMVGVSGDLVADISDNRWGKPLWLTPHVYYGVSDKFTAGITANPKSQFFPTGGGFCMSSSRYCGKVFIPNNVSLDLLFSFNRAAMMEIAFHGGIDLGAIDPFVASGRAGLLIKIRITNEVSIMADPSLSAGITKRTELNNKEYLSVPIRVGYQLHPQVNAGLFTGINSALSGFADRFQVPLGVGVLGALNPKIDAALNLTFAAIAGNVAPNTSNFDYRSVALTVNYRM
jgi:hypothetical protein